MVFFGTNDSLNEWRTLLATELGKLGSEIITIDNRDQFSIKLTKEERNILQENFWYVNSPTTNSPWNWRIAFSE